MKIYISILVIILLAFAAELFLPWWSIAIISFLVTLIFNLNPGRGFVAGLAGIATFWLVMALCQDIPNEHILSQKMAALFHLPGYVWFIFVIVLIGGVVGGIAGWSGSMIRKMFT